MNPCKYSLCLLAILSLALACESAKAAVGYTCSASTAAPTALNYDPDSTIPTTSVGSVTVTCSSLSIISPTAVIKVALSSGSGSYSDRTLRNGNAALLYNIYTTSNHSITWGDGSGSSVIQQQSRQLSITPQAMTFNYYIRLLPEQNVPPGSYTDTINVTVTY